MQTNIRRPLSHRAPKKLHSSSIHTSCARLRRLQNLLPVRGADCILCVQGIDSRYNEGTQNCIDYLLFGLLESRREDRISSANDEDITEDLIICIKAGSVEVYCNPLNYALILPCVAAWPDLSLHCLSKEQYDSDDDVAEEFKIKCFVSMVSKCKHVLVPYFSKLHAVNSEFDQMKVEQWPIVQAYALEGYGRGTFFTLQHDVSDISTALLDVYDTFDAVSTEEFVTEQLPVFERQWEEMNKTVEVARLTSFSDGFTEINAAEPLLTYFSHGRVGAFTDLSTSSIWQRPFVYMGLQTKYLTSTIPVPTVADISTAGVGGTKAMHMVCHGVAPRSGLVCTRTYFFDSSSLPPIIGGATEYRNIDAEQLSRAYRAAIEVTLKSITDYASDPRASQIVENAKRNVINGLQKWMDCRELDVVVKVESRLHDGRFKFVDDRTTPQCVVTMSVVIGNIQSSRDKKLCLGAVAYSDSFLLSSVKHKSANDGTELVDGAALILTENIPRWSCWNISEACAEMSAKMDSLVMEEASCDAQLKLCGDQLIDGQLVELVSPQSWLQPITCTLHLYSHTVLLLNHAVGPIMLTKEDIKSVSFYDAGGPSVPAFVTLYTSMDFQTKLPTQLHNTGRMLVISLSPRTKAYKQFFEQVFEAWKVQEGGSFSLTMEDKLPSVLHEVHAKVASDFKAQVTRPLNRLISRSSAHEKSHLIGLQRFIDHIAISACVTQLINYSDVPALLDRSADEATTAADDAGVVLTISIISGIPGSYKENVANFITKLTQERSRWVIHKQTAESSHRFDAGKLENTLSYVYGALKKKSNAAAKSSRMLVITPGFTDVQTVVNVIQSHPNKELRQHVTIGAVTTCVDPHNSFVYGQHTVPGLLNQCAYGWVNNVVLTSSSELGNGNISRIQSLVRAVNPRVNFIITDRGELTRSQDIELILSVSAFQQLENVRSRQLVVRTPRSSAESYGLNTVSLKFKQPLIRQKLISRLKELHLVEPRDGAVLYIDGRCQFTGSDDVFDVSYASVSNIPKLTPAQLKPEETIPYSFMAFTGYGLNEPELKSLLRLSVQPKPEKKEYLTSLKLDGATKNTIHKEKHLEPLPPGWFYNGSQYVDMTGERMEKHPDFERFLQEYIDTENKLIEDFNASIDKLDFHDLFE